MATAHPLGHPSIHPSIAGLHPDDTCLRLPAADAAAAAAQCCSMLPRQCVRWQDGTGESKTKRGPVGGATKRCKPAVGVATVNWDQALATTTCLCNMATAWVPRHSVDVAAVVVAAHKENVTFWEHTEAAL